MEDQQKQRLHFLESIGERLRLGRRFGRHLVFGQGSVDANHATSQGRAVESVNAGLALLVRSHVNEGETLGFARFRILGDAHESHRSVRFKECFDLVVRGL